MIPSYAPLYSCDCPGMPVDVLDGGGLTRTASRSVPPIISTLPISFEHCGLRWTAFALPRKEDRVGH
jgi:hypothetical protein